VTTTLAAARTEVRSLIDEDAAAFWTDSMLNNWLNQGAQDISRQAQCLWMQASIPAVAGQQSYMVPADFLGVHRLDYSIDNSDQTYNLEYHGIKTMDEIWGILHQLPAAYPRAFYLWNDTGVPGGQWYFATYPVIAATGTLTLYYYRQAQVAVNDTDLLDLTPGYEDICYEYAVAKAKRRDRDPLWQEAMGMYSMQLINMFNKTSRFTDQGDQFTSGNPQWPVYAYTDSSDGW